MKTTGRIIKMKLGVNPNSSSIGTDIIYMMLGTAGTAALVFIVSGILRLRRRAPDDAKQTRDHHLSV